MAKSVRVEPSTSRTLHEPAEGIRRTPDHVLQLALVGTVLLALILRLIGLAWVPLWGDEYGSLQEATTHFGSNLTSLPYDVVLHVFMRVSTRVEILRLPAVIFGVAAVGAMYRFAAALTDRWTGIVAALLLATSSYAIGYSQLVRFYTLFLLTGLIALHAAVLVIRDGPSPRRIAWLVAANALCIACHIVGLVLVVGEAVSLPLALAQEQRRRRFLFLAAALLFLGVLALAIPEIRAWGIQALNRYQESNGSTGNIRGFGVSNVIKVAFTYFVFIFGERVYPLWYWLTLPGSLVAGTFFVLGLWRLRRNRLALTVLVPQLVLGPILLYFVADTFLPGHGLPSGSPRYLIPLLGCFLVLIAAGITGWRSPGFTFASLAVVLALNGVALVAYWQNAWNYNGYSPDWPRAAALIRQDAVPGTRVLLDGRSVGAAQYYFTSIERARRAIQMPLAGATLTSVGSAPRVVVVSDTDRSDSQAVINRALASIQQRYRVVAGFVRYPLFVYVMDRVPSHTVSVAGWTSLALPVDIYSLSLQDLALPVLFAVPGGNRPIPIWGVMTFSSDPLWRSRTLSLPSRFRARRMYVVTTLQDDASLPEGTPIATVTLAGKGHSVSLTLRKGEQVDDWQRPSAADAREAYSWTKLVSLVGQRSYSGAYRQFQASMLGAALTIPNDDYRAAHIRYLAPSGTLQVWAVAFQG